jgi:uncharacterized membrane protein YtjA (UPF0391 family)
MGQSILREVHVSGLDPNVKRNPCLTDQTTAKGVGMLRYALVFLIIAIIAGILGFGSIAFAAAGIAKILFFIFLVLFVVGLIMHLGRGRPVV